MKRAASAMSVRAVLLVAGMVSAASALADPRVASMPQASGTDALIDRPRFLALMSASRLSPDVKRQIWAIPETFTQGLPPQLFAKVNDLVVVSNETGAQLVMRLRESEVAEHVRGKSPGAPFFIGTHGAIVKDGFVYVSNDGNKPVVEEHPVDRTEGAFYDRDAVLAVVFRPERRFGIGFALKAASCVLVQDVPAMPAETLKNLEAELRTRAAQAGLRFTASKTGAMDRFEWRGRDPVGCLPSVVEYALPAINQYAQRKAQYDQRKR